MVRLTTRDAAQTLELGRWIGRRLAPGSVVGLDGDLGAGKTWMAKGLVRGIGDHDETLVKSPAFNLIHEYPTVRDGTHLSVIHIDFYRLDDLSETDFLLFSEYFERPASIWLVEWARKFLCELAPRYLAIDLSPCVAGDDECRTFAVGAVGGGYGELLEGLRDHAYADL